MSRPVCYDIIDQVFGEVGKIRQVVADQKGHLNSCLTIIRRARRHADDYIERWQEDNEMDITAEDDPETYYDEWGYAFLGYFEDA